MTSPPVASPVEHWAFQVDNPLRPPAEIRELAGSSRAAVEAGASPWLETEDLFFGEDLSQAEDEFEAYDASEPSSEADAYEGSELAETELLEETPASEHPLASVFTLPRLAFDAMAKGGWATAIATAVGTGLRDVNQLTNMVFWFKHPQMIGQRIGADQRDLARQWLQIRDEIIKPALQGGLSAAPTPTQAPGGWASSASKAGGARTSIPSDMLRWHGPAGEETPELVAFMRKVYDLHVQRSQGGFVDTLPASAVEEIESGKYARKDAAAKAREMLSAARAALAADGLTGMVRIGVLSAYRSADYQYDIWQGKTTKGRGGFPHYYAETRATRRHPKYGGEHSDKAAAYLAKQMGRYVAAPGYSNHQDGLALDLGTRKGKGGLIKLYPGSWFHTWLRANASRFQFEPYASEAWHWIYRPSPGGSASEAFASEVTPTAVRAGTLQVARVPLLARHRGRSPDLILRWNDIPTFPTEIDVVVHLHGYTSATMTLPKQIEVWAGLDLAPVDGASGTGRTRPTLTVLPRGHFTGIKVGKTYRYTFPALTTKDGLTSLVRVALERFSDRVGGSPPKVGRLILTAHSGGGAPLMQILRRHDPQEVYVFDGLYQDAASLAEWVRRHLRADRLAVEAGDAPTSAMRVFFGPTTRGFSLRLHKELAADLEGAPAAVRDRYRVESSSLGHWQIARQYGWRMLSDPGADVPSAVRPATKKYPTESLLEVDPAEMPFLPEALFLAEAPFLPETVDAAEADEADAVEEADEADAVGKVGGSELWEGIGESDYESDPELRESEGESEDETGLGQSPDALEVGDQEDEDPKDGAAMEGWLEMPASEAGADELKLNELEGDPLALEEGETAVHDLDEEPQELEALDGYEALSSPLLIAPTVGFEFDVHYGVIPAVVSAAGLGVPADGDLITMHKESTHGFKVKLDGQRLEIATKPFTVDRAGRADLEGAITHAAAFAKELTAGHKSSSGSTVTIPGVSGHPRPFTLLNSVVPGLPIARLWVRGAFNPDLDSVWASPQATVTVRLDRVPALIRAIRDSEGRGAGAALSGSSGQRAGVRSEAAYRALREADRVRTRMLTARPRTKLSDGTVVDEKAFTPALQGFLILLAMYLWTSEVPYRFEDSAPRGLRDYEPFTKAYLPMNVKAPFSEIYRALLTDQERKVYRELFADGPARVRLFALARPAGATSADGDRLLFPTGPKEHGLDSVHERQKAEFTSVPTWNDLVDHTLDPTHRGWGERLLVPMSRPIPVSRTSPRVAIELRRIGFASVYARQWPGLMRSAFRLVHQLDQ